MIIGLLVFTPMVTGMATLLSAGWIGFAGTVAMGLVARYADSTPQAPAWVEMPKLNIPQSDPNLTTLPESPDNATEENSKEDGEDETESVAEKPVPKPEQEPEEKDPNEPEVWT